MSETMDHSIEITRLSRIGSHEAYTEELVFTGSRQITAERACRDYLARAMPVTGGWANIIVRRSGYSGDAYTIEVTVTIRHEGVRVHDDHP
jgi:hypothetical protein